MSEFREIAAEPELAQRGATTWTFTAESAPAIVEAAAGDKTPPRFSMVAYRGGPMIVNAFDDPVVVDLEGIRVMAAKIPVRIGHDARRLVGHTEQVGIEGGQVVASGILSFESMDARAVASSSRNGFPWQASIGAAALHTEFVPRGRVAEANGRTVEGPANIVRRSLLTEISFVDIGADNSTSATVAAQRHHQERSMPGESDKGGTAASGQEQDNKQAAAAGAGAPGAAPQPGSNKQRVEAAAGGPSQVVAAQRAEAERKNQITELVAGAVADVPDDVATEIGQIGDKAIAENWTVDRAENKILRAQMLARERGGRGQGQVPALHLRTAGPLSNEVLATALLLQCGVSDEKLSKDRNFGERAVEAAWKRKGGMTLHGLMAYALKAEGVDAPHGGEALFRAVVEHQIKAGFSTVNLPGILGTAGNKLLLEAFTAVDATYPFIAAQVDVSNFLQWTSYRLNDVGAFAKVSSSGELKHGRLEQDSYTNQLDTRGQMLTLTRQQIVNDDLNAFQSLYAILGRKAALAIEKALYALVMEGSDVFYTSARGNRLTTTALTVANLGAGEAAMLAQLDGDGEPIYANPTTLIVPPALKALADTIYSSATVIGSSSTNVPAENPYRGRFRPISSPYLSLSTMTGSSATTWYLAANPTLLPAWQVAFLNGRRAPTVETADASFNTLGIQMRCYWDFGVAQADYRGAVKATA